MQPAFKVDHNGGRGEEQRGGEQQRKEWRREGR